LKAYESDECADDTEQDLQGIAAKCYNKGPNSPNEEHLHEEAAWMYNQNH
jgi:hypothetical protein